MYLRDPSDLGARRRGGARLGPLIGGIPRGKASWLSHRCCQRHSEANDAEPRRSRGGALARGPGECVTSGDDEAMVIHLLGAGCRYFLFVSIRPAVTHCSRLPITGPAQRESHSPMTTSVKSRHHRAQFCTQRAVGSTRSGMPGFDWPIWRLRTTGRKIQSCRRDHPQNRCLVGPRRHCQCCRPTRLFTTPHNHAQEGLTRGSTASETNSACRVLIPGFCVAPCVVELPPSHHHGASLSGCKMYGPCAAERETLSKYQKPGHHATHAEE